VADVTHGHSMALEKLLFKGEDAEEAVDDAAHRFDAAPAPGPDLGRYKINHRNAFAVQSSGHAEMEIGGIGEYGKRRFAGGGYGDQFPVTKPDPRQMPEDFDEPDYCKVLSSDYRLDSFGAQMRSGASEEST